MNGYSGGYIPSDYFIVKENERRRLKKLGSLAGLAICGYVLLQNVIVLLIQELGLLDKYENNDFFRSGADIIITFASVLLPFAVASIFMKKHTGIDEPVIFGRKTGITSVAVAVIGGTGLCIAANIVSTVFIVFFQAFGFTLTSPDVPMAYGVSGVFMSFVRVAVVAAVAEELALRGYVLGNLRHYGDIFAVSVSAVMFAFMHGNLVQAPFALIAGFVLGYFTLKTGTIWTGILIHAFNNMISLILSYMMDILSEETASAIYLLTIAVMSVAGVVFSTAFVIKYKNQKLVRGHSFLSAGEKTCSFFINIPMFCAFAIMLYITSNFVEFGG